MSLNDLRVLVGALVDRNLAPLKVLGSIWSGMFVRGLSSAGSECNTDSLLGTSLVESDPGFISVPV